MITIHDAAASDFSGLGLGALLPIECEIEEIAGGMFELRMVHPIDTDGKWRHIEQYRIIKAPAPVRETPLIDISSGGELYEVNVSSHLRLRSEPSTSTGKIVGRYKDGTRVVKVGESGSWYEVIVQDGGAAGWMHSDYLVRVQSQEGAREAVQPRQTREQLFRIETVEVDDQAGMVSLTALHITYDLSGNIVKNDYAPENASPAAVCEELLARAIHPHDFHIYCTAEGHVSGDYGRRSIISALLDPDIGVVPQSKGNLVRDNTDLFVLKDEKRDRGVEIRHGKNLTGAVMTVDASSVVTRIVPMGRKKDGKPLYLNGDGYVDSPRSSQYPTIYARAIEYDVQVVRSSEADPDAGKYSSESAARTRLQELAREDFEKNMIDLPAVGLEVDFVALEHTAAYSQYADLQSIHMYDVVKVISPRSGINAELRMTGYVWDVLANGGKGRYSAVTLGDMNMSMCLDASGSAGVQSALAAEVGALHTTAKDIQDQINEMPDALPNPHALTFAGGASATYDGSAAVNVKIPEKYVHPVHGAIIGGPLMDQEPGFGESFEVDAVSSNNEGHVTGMISRKVTIPNSLATASAAGLMSANDKEALDAVPQKIQAAVADKADVGHTHEEYANQNAFGKVVVGSTTIMADSAADTLTVAAGSNITLTPDASGDKLTISAKDTVYEHPVHGAIIGGPLSNQTPAFGGVFDISAVSTNNEGHVVGITGRTVKIPDAEATSTAAGLMSAADKAALDAVPSKIKAVTESLEAKVDGKADAVHSHSSYVNQNAFSNVAVGNVTIAADKATDTLTLAAGDNVTLTADASGDKVTISAIDTVYEHPVHGAIIGGPLEDQTPAFGDTFEVDAVRTNNEGHVTGIVGKTVKIPNSVATSTTAGLMSAADKVALDGVPAKIVATSEELSAEIAKKADAGHGHSISQVSGLQTALDGKDEKGSAAAVLNAATAYTDASIAALIGSADSTMDTLGEVQAAMKGNADVVEALNQSIGKKANASDLTAHTGNTSNPHKVSLSQLGVTATAAEVNYMDGVTANVQTQLDGKAAQTHGHAIGDVDGLEGALAGKANVHEYIGALTGKPTAAQSPAFGGTFSVSQVKTDDAGHVTSLTSRNITIPSTAATTSVAGLMSAADKTKLDGIAEGANKIVVDTALSSSSANPVQNKAVHSALAGKSDTGHTHSAYANQNAFSNVKVGETTIAAESTTDTLTLVAGDNVTLTPDATNDKVTIAAKDTVYTHPSYTARTGVPTANATPGFGGTFSVSQPVSDATGHITGLNSRTITIPSAVATSSAAGLMSSGDKAKLDGVAENANFYVHEYNGALTGAPTANATPGFGSTFTVSQVVTNDGGHVTALTSRTVKIPNATATTSAAGLMSASDKTALDGIPDKLAGKADTGHTHSTYVNQNAFSNVKVGDVTVAADSATDTLTLVAGSNVTLTPDATNDKITIAATDTVYTHPSYTARTGVPTANQTPGFGGTFSVSQPVSDTSGHITAVNSRTITIPSTAATTSAAGLMSAADKTKLDGIATGANKITVDTALSSTSTNPVQNKVVQSALAGKAASGHTHDAATTSAAGLMSAEDKAKLDGIAANANNFVEEYLGALTGKPTANQTPGFGSTFTISQVTTNDAGKVTGMTDRTVKIPSTAATTSAAGLMSAADKTKLDGIATGANKITVDTALSSTSTNPVQNKVVQSALAGKSDTDHTHSAYLAASSFTNANLGQGYGTCATAAATVAKVVTLSGYTLTTGGVVTVKFTYAVPAGATMNINSKGAKAIYYRGAAIIAGIIEAGDAATFIYDGTRYHLLTVDRHRFFSLLVPYGVAIGANADLNTTTYMKVGNYYCGANATAKTLVNCPTTSAFMMTVASPLSTSIDNETTGTWVYRLRKLQVYTGEEFVQYCYAGGTAGTWTYGAWLKSIKSNNTATASAAGLMSAADKSKLDGIAANANNYVHEYNGALTGNPTANQTPGFGSTFTVSQVTTNDGGHVTGLTSRTVKIPNTTATSSAAGLMSAADKQALDGVPAKIAAKANAENGVYYIEGSGSATSAWKGSHSDITAYYAGLAILYKNDATGQSDVETTLNINGLGAVTVKRNTSTTITTHYPIGSVILLTYTEDSGTAYFKTADYDANNYAYVRQYYTTSANNYPLLTKYDAGTSTTTSYVTKYSRYSNKFYANPSTGVLTAPTFSGSLSGNATSATSAAALTTPRTLSFTGAVAGSGNFDGSANLSIALGATASSNLDTVISSGVHFGFYSANTSTTGSPYAAGVTGWGSALVLSFGSSANNAVQIAFSAGTSKIFVRQRASGTTGSWTAIN